jgi:hypothetical protein
MKVGKLNGQTFGSTAVSADDQFMMSTGGVWYPKTQARLNQISGLANPTTVKLLQLGTDGVVTSVDPPVGEVTQSEFDTGIASRQPLDGDLTAIAALATTTYGRSVLTRVDAASDRQAIHGRDIQYGSTKPTIRSTGTTLVSGDHWYDTNNQWWCYWDGTRWLTQQIYQNSSIIAATNLTATARYGILRIPTATFSLAIIDFQVSVARAATQDTTTNYWTVTLERLTATQAVTISATINLNTNLASGGDCVNGTVGINTVFSTASSIALWRVGWNKLGTAGGLSQGTAMVRYRLAYP